MDFDKTVLQIVPALDAGGAERTTVEIAQAIVAAGGRALVATSGGRLEADLERAGGEVLRLPAHSKNPVAILANAARLGRIVRDRKVDLLHVRSRAPAWSALIAARAASVPLVSTYHGAYEARSALKRLYNSSMVRADLVIANSRFTAGAIAAQYEVEPGRLRVIPRGADLALFSPEAVAPARIEALRAAWGISAGDFIVLLPARITPWKGHAVAIRAAERLKRAAGIGRSLRLIFAGDAQGREDHLAALRREIVGRGVSDMIRFVGHCADMPAAFLIANAVLSTSTRPEAFGRTLAEAGAMGRVVVASDHGGARETIIDGRTGVLVPPADDVAVAEALEAVVAMGPSGRAEMGARGRARIARDYSVEAMQRATLAAYRDILH